MAIMPPPPRAATYLAPAINDMWGLLVDQPSPTQEMVDEAALIGCQALGELERNRDFFDAVNYLASQRGSRPEEYERLFEQVEEFKRFLEVERVLLEEAGVHPVVVDAIIDAVSDNLDLIRTGECDPTELSRQVNQLREQTCQLAGGQPQDREKPAWVRKAMWGIVGCTTILLNASSMATELFGIGSGGPELSYAIGGAFFGPLQPRVD